MEQKMPVTFTETAELTIPEFGSIPQQVLDLSKIKHAEKRMLETRVVNPATYNDLEYTMNEGYRQAKKHISAVMYQIALAKKAIRQAKSEALIDEYKDWLKEVGLKDSAGIRDAFLEKQVPYVQAQDRLDMLLAIESIMEGKIKVFENICRYMRKEMELVKASGVINHNKYVT